MTFDRQRCPDYEKELRRGRALADSRRRRYLNDSAIARIDEKVRLRSDRAACSRMLGCAHRPACADPHRRPPDVGTVVALRFNTHTRQRQRWSVTMV